MAPLLTRVVRRLLALPQTLPPADGRAILLMLVAAGLTLLIPYLMKVAIDQHITRRIFPG